MAEVQAAETDLLHTKWGPAPVWVWALLGLAAAYLYSKYKANQSGATSSTTTPTNASEDQAVAPQFIIEEGDTSTTVNNAGGPSAPVASTPPTPPVTSPPGTTNKPPVKVPIQGGKPPAKPAAGPTKAAQPTVYRVKPGDNLTSIANRFHVKGGASALYNYQLSSPLRSAQAKQEIRSRGPNLLVSNEEILIPPA